jgi:hypothetical protein
LPIDGAAKLDIIYNLVYHAGVSCFYISHINLITIILHYCVREKAVTKGFEVYHRRWG